jgi:hypothetical protein
LRTPDDEICGCRMLSAFVSRKYDNGDRAKLRSAHKWIYLWVEKPAFR